MGIRTLPSPEKGVKRHWDKDGLCLQVSQGGTKTFYFVHGDDRRFLKLGRYPAMSLSQARERVRTILAKQVLGIEDETSKVTVQQAIDRYVTTHCEVNNKPRTAAETKRLLRYLSPMAKRPITAIRTPEIMSLIETASPSMSERRHLFVAARAYFRWASRHRLIKSSPLQDLQAPGHASIRTRLLTDDEMARIYKAAKELGYPYGSICLIAIHTGMRRGEVGNLKWAYITEDAITLPASTTKNKREHVLPNLLKSEFDAIPKASEYVFPSAVDTPYSTWSDGKEALDALCGVENFVVHDFRRYLSTTMAKLRVPIDVTEAILNHVSGSRSPIQRVYDRHNRLPEMREALELYARHLAKIVGSADV